MRARRGIYALGAATIGLVLSLGGCGDSDDTGATNSSQRGDDVRELKDVHTRMTAAIYRGDHQAACDLISDRAQQSVLRNAPSGITTCEGLFAKFYAPNRLLKPPPRLLKVKVVGDRATGTVRSAGANPRGSRTASTPFVRIDGEWKVDSL